MAGRATRYHGVLLLDKPVGFTSHDAVARVRRITDQRRVGHTGTLDPLAEGLLVLCLGRATKVAQFISAFDKTYRARVCLGQESPTLDSEGIDGEGASGRAPNVDVDKLRELLPGYRGKRSQKVPAYSAVRVDGQRLYKLARKGVDVEPPEREIEIKDLELLDFDSPYFTMRVTCSPGTYIRSLADEIGKALGCGAYLSGLRRLAVGELTVEEALSLKQVEQFREARQLAQCLRPAEAVLPYGAITITDAFKDGVFHGRTVTPAHVVSHDPGFRKGDRLLLKDTKGRVLAVGTAEMSSGACQQYADRKLFSYLRVLG